MKHGDRFLNNSGTAYILVETLGYWYLLNESTGCFWVGKGHNTPIEAFGGQKWHNSFRKLPPVKIEYHTFNEDDRSYDVLYLVDNDGKDVSMCLQTDGKARRNLLIESTQTYKFEDLEPIED